jgi:hypothetical protein
MEEHPNGGSPCGCKLLTMAEHSQVDQLRTELTKVADAYQKELSKKLQ